MNQIDGKLVEVEARQAHKTTIEQSANENESLSMIRTDGTQSTLVADFTSDKNIPSLLVFNKKVASLNQEYTAMLASTLESQRVFFQENLS